MAQCVACSIQCNEDVRSCPKCLKTYCPSCYLLKQKLEASTCRRRNCNCSQFIALKTTGRDKCPSSEQIKQDKRQVRETTDLVNNPSGQTIHNKIQIQDEVSKTNSTGNIETNNELTGQALKYDTTPEKPKRMQPTATNASKNPALPQRKAGIAHTREAPVPPGNNTPGRQWSESESDSDDDNKGRRHRVVPMKPRFQSGSYPSTHWNKSYSDTSNSEWHDSEGSYSLTDYFDDDFIGEDQDMDKFDEIPPYDEIPYALICCGVYDEKSIRIAQKKQVQKKLLQNCQKESKIPSNVDKNGEIHQNGQERKEIEKEFDDLINDFKNIAEELSSGNTDKSENALFETIQHQETETQNKQTLLQPLQTTFEENDISNPANGNPPFTTSSTDCTNSLKMSITQNSKTSTANEHTGDNSKDYLNKKETDSKNAGTTILETQKDVQSPPSPVNVESSADEQYTKANCPSSRHESEQKKRMREKRLQKFQQDRKSTRAGNRNTPKLDNRDLAPNSQPLLKPIKCKAFKHNLTVEELENKETIHDRHDNKTQHEMPREVKQTSVSKERDYSTITDIADENTREIFDTKHNKSSSESDSDDDSVVPMAMRVLNTSTRRDEASKSKRDLSHTTLDTILSIATTNKIKPALKGSGEQNGQQIDNGNIAQNGQPLSKLITCKTVKHNSTVEVLNKEQKNKETIHDKHDNKTQHEMTREVKQENVSTERVNSTRTVKADERPREIKETQHTLSSNKSDSDDDSVVPTAMRALNTPDRNDKVSKSKRDFAATFLDTILGIATDNKTKPALKGSGKQNKNKTSTKSSSGSGILKDKVSKPCMNDEEMQTFIDTIESTLETKAETLHSAFEHLRMKQSRLPKCPACGSTDCKVKSGGAVQELVVAARKEGYEVHDVSPDGNCMFAALVDQLEMYGDTRFDARSLRETAVNWLKEHPHLNDGENTHFQSFIDEDWDAYLQRMIMDGEWGDHLQLRAVSNVVESTIKVLSIRNRDVVWTSIVTDKDTHSIDRVLTVGNVSERHYASLWPSERNLESGNSDKPMPLETQLPEELDTYQDPAELAMFGSDYVDPVSGVPSCHVSFLLNAVAPLRTVLDESAIISSQIVDQANVLVETFEKMPKTYHSHPLDIDPVPVGSFMEGTFHPPLCWLQGKDNEMIHWQNSGILLKMQLSKDSIVLEEGSCCKFGYTRILQPSTSLYENKPTFVYKPHVQRAPFNFPIPFRHSQPKVSGSVPMEPIYCYSISKWPNQAREWLVRKRYQNWPPQHIRSEIESKGCVLSASCHPTSDSPNIEWKFLFAEADTLLFKEALSEHQKYCYLLFRYFCMQNLSEVQPFNIDIPNSIFFFSCERIPCDVWETSIAGCLLFMINELKSGMRKKGIPHYFIAKNNMIDHFSTEEINLVEESLCQFLLQPILHIRRLNESLEVLTNYSTVFEKISDNLQQFASMKSSTLQVFVPCQIEIAQFHIRRFNYEGGLEKLNEAFQERLAVSTCDDSMPFQVFLQAAFSGLNFAATVWFALYADKMLQGQLSKTLMREVCSDLHLLRIDEVLPNDVAGTYAESEVPVSFTLSLDSFCHDYAAFLAFVGKKSEALPVLEFCAVKHRQYQRHLKEMTENGKDFDNCTLFSDDSMFSVYAAMFALYNGKYECDKFCEYSDDASKLVTRMEKGYALSWLRMVMRVLYGEAGLKRLDQPNQSDSDVEVFANLLVWPDQYLMW